MVIVADHHVAPGKKFFAWAMGRKAACGTRCLPTPTAVSRTDVRRLLRQPARLQLDRAGRSEDRGTILLSDRELGGIKNANLDATVNLEVYKQKIRFAFNTTTEFRDANVSYRQTTRFFSIGRSRLVHAAVCPGTTFAGGSETEELNVALLAADRREIIAYMPRRRESGPMPQPVQPPLAPRTSRPTRSFIWPGCAWSSSIVRPASRSLLPRGPAA